MGLFDDFFYYSKRQRNGIIVLISILLLVLLINVFLPFFITQRSTDISEFKSIIEKASSSIESDSISVEITLFDFDPNYLTIDEGKLLGFDEKQITSLHKFIEKGGKFKTKTDFAKMYFVNDSIFKKLEPYIKIKELNYSNTIVEEKAELFYFNPNNLPNEYWLKLGFKEWQVRIIKNFEEKGGCFKTASKLKSIYGVDSTLFSKIESYIIIYNDSVFISGSDNNCKALSAVSLFNNKFNGVLKSNEEVKKVKLNCENVNFFVWNKGQTITYDSIVDYSKARNKTNCNNKKELITVKLNTADTTDFKQIRGIGSKLSNRIVDYRNKLRGFITKEQLKEVYGISDSLYTALEKLIILDEKNLEPININTCDFKELVSHPYISKNVAVSIINYRESHGSYKKVEDIKASVLVNDALLFKIAPYLKVE